MAKLSDAGMRVFRERGYHAARVDDIVRAARISHGSFYLYFANKEDLLRALAIECADEMRRLADELPPVTGDADGRAALRSFLARFLATYRKYGPVMRAWMEGQVTDAKVNRLGVRAFTEIGNALGRRMREQDDSVSEAAAVAACMALLERVSYFLTSRGTEADDDALLDTLTTIVHRAFFAGAPA
ncbi:MAG: helix-turn-helix domain-containing protein [Acidimicrobiia bacterium]